MIEQFLKPASVDDAIRLKREYGDAAVFMAGGSKLNAAPTRTDKKVAISLAGLALDGIVERAGQLSLGATLSLQQLIDDARVPAALREAAGFVYSRNVRNQATLGGEVCALQDEALLMPVLLALEAQLLLGDGRSIELEDFVARAGNADGVLVLAILLPEPARPCVTRKIARSAAGLRVLTAAAALTATGPRIAVEGVVPRPVRLREIEPCGLSGTELEEVVRAAVAPQDDIRGSAAYKRYLAGVVVADLLADLAAGAEPIKKGF